MVSTAKFELRQEHLEVARGIAKQLHVLGFSREMGIALEIILQNTWLPVPYIYQKDENGQWLPYKAVHESEEKEDA